MQAGRQAGHDEKLQRHGQGPCGPEDHIGPFACGQGNPENPGSARRDAHIAKRVGPLKWGDNKSHKMA